MGKFLCYKLCLILSPLKGYVKQSVVRKKGCSFIEKLVSRKGQYWDHMDRVAYYRFNMSDLAGVSLEHNMFITNCKKKKHLLKLRCLGTRFRSLLKKGPDLTWIIITSTILHSSTTLIHFYIRPPFAICNLQIQTLCCVIDFTIWYTQSKLVTHESVYISAGTRPIYYLIKAFEYSQNTCMNDYVIQYNM